MLHRYTILHLNELPSVRGVIYNKRCIKELEIIITLVKMFPDVICHHQTRIILASFVENNENTNSLNNDVVRNFDTLNEPFYILRSMRTPTPDVIKYRRGWVPLLLLH